ncbi:MAG: FadR/GntR family transcriptional regulator [Acidobacteriota bacterium]
MEKGKPHAALGPADAMKPVSRSSLSDKIVEQIVDLIARDVLKPGDRLPSEKELCKRFGVGRTSIREALRSLTVMGLLTGKVGEGTYVAPTGQRFLERNLQWSLLLDPKKVEDLLEIRLMLETQTASSAAARATAEDLKEIQQAIRAMEDSLGTPEKYLEADLEFHLLIARSTQNSILYNLLCMTRGYLQDWIKGSLADPAIPRIKAREEASIREHKRILKALQKKSPEEARRAMTEHILSSSKDLQAHLRSTHLHKETVSTP